MAMASGIFFWRPEVVFLVMSLYCSPMKLRFSLDFVAHGMLHWVGIKFCIERVQWDTEFLTLIKTANQFCQWQCWHCHYTKVAVSNQMAPYVCITNCGCWVVKIELGWIGQSPWYIHSIGVVVAVSRRQTLDHLQGLSQPSPHSMTKQLPFRVRPPSWHILYRLWTDIISPG